MPGTLMLNGLPAGLTRAVAVLTIALSCVVGPARGADSAATQAPAVAAGYAVVMGGAVVADNDAVWSRLVQLAGGPGARYVVFATASGNPERSAARIIANLRRHGAVAEHVAVAPMLPGVDVTREVENRKWIELVRGARGVYFAGGEQARIVDTLMPGGKVTPLLQAVWDVYRSGGVVAGTSAGAAIMSATMIRDGGDIMSMLRGTIRPGKEIDRGIGFVGDGLFTDQHFLRRGRIGRLLPVMVATGYTRGLGVEENTAAIVHDDEVEIVGAGGALFVDLERATGDSKLGAFNLRGARLSFLASGDRLNLATGDLSPAAGKLADTKLDWKSAGFKPQTESVPFQLDMLGNWTIVHAMGALVDSRATELKGLAYDAMPRAGDPLAALGFEFRLYKGEGTVAWFTDASGADAYTIKDVYLDVTPVRMAQPLYTPWQAR
jgi:cyanophycinase